MYVYIYIYIYPWPLARWSATVPALILCLCCLVFCQRMFKGPQSKLYHVSSMQYLACILHVLHFDKECREICKASFSMPLEGRMGGSRGLWKACWKRKILECAWKPNVRFLKAVESPWKAFGKLFGSFRERFGRIFEICVLWLGGRAVIELA